MSEPYELLSSGVAYRLGWTLLHSLWQGAAVAGLFGLALLIIPARRSDIRYLAGCCALAVLVVACGVTFLLIPPASPQAAVAIAPPEPSALGMESSGEKDRISSGLATAELMRDANAPRAETAEPLIGTARETPARSAAAESLQDRLARWIRPVLPWLALVWTAGVLGLSVWRLGGCVAMHRLRRMGASPADDEIVAIVWRCCESLRVSRPVCVLRSTVIRTPAVIGHLRPVILLPVSALTGLSAGEMEAIIAHELAHIRRYDYLVGLFQTVIEILFFHHPAVWWISRRIRIEREYCCDDLVVSLGKGRLVYARALAKLTPFEEHPEAAMAASGGSLLERIQRLAGTEADEPASRSRSAAGLMLSLFLVLGSVGIAGHILAGPAAQGSSDGESQASTTQPAPLSGLEPSVERILLQTDGGSRPVAASTMPSTGSQPAADSAIMKEEEVAAFPTMVTTSPAVVGRVEPATRSADSAQARRPLGVAAESRSMAMPPVPATDTLLIDLSSRFAATQPAASQPTDATPMISMEVRFITAPAKEDARILSGVGALAPISDEFVSSPLRQQLNDTWFTDEMVDPAVARREQRAAILDSTQVDTLLHNQQQIMTSAFVDAPRLVMFDRREAYVQADRSSQVMLPVVQADPGRPRQLAAPIFHGRRLVVTPALSADGQRVTLALDAIVDRHSEVGMDTGTPVVSELPVLKRVSTNPSSGGSQARAILEKEFPLGQVLLVRTPMLKTEVKGLRPVKDAVDPEAYEVIRETKSTVGEPEMFLYLLVKPKLVKDTSHEQAPRVPSHTR